MNYPNQQHLPPPNSYPIQLPPDRSIPPNMMNPQFKNYHMQQMMMKPQGQRPPPQVYHPGANPQPHPQYIPPQMPPSQMNPNMNPMIPNMMAQGQTLPPQMNNPNYQQHMNIRRAPTMENPHIKMEAMGHDQAQMIALPVRKKIPQMNPPIPMNNPNIVQYAMPGPTPIMNPINSPGNASPNSNSQNQLLNSNTKDPTSSKSKPSELTTLGLKINNHNITGHDILTKIFFGKKQIVWELVESGQSNEKKEPVMETPRKEKEDEGENEAGNIEETNASESFKKKFDVKFNDIESIEINVEKSTMIIGN